MSDEILKRLDALAAKLGIATEHLWSVLVKQGTVEGAYGVAMMAAGAGLILCGALLGRKALSKESMNSDGPERFIGFLIPAMVGTVFGFISIGAGFFLTKYLFNPEMYALTEILRVLK